ncbi:MAG: hypothetical protein DMG16_02755 [Acidobacteria bacterium]|nr:MAG: hypothetical protein DMG16_02755 [Acidobacteriota bacterium]
MSLLDVFNEIHRTLGELRHELGTIKGELIEIRRLSYRVSMLEQNQAWLKGGWAVLAAACGYLFHGIFTK